MSALDGCEVAEKLIDGPVLCWVSNRHGEKSVIRLVTEYFDSRFFVDGGERFNFARLLSADDKKHFLRD